MASEEKTTNKEVTQLSALTALCEVTPGPDPDREIGDERVGSEVVVLDPGGSLPVEATPDPDDEVDDEQIGDVRRDLHESCSSGEEDDEAHGTSQNGLESTDALMQRITSILRGRSHTKMSANQVELCLRAIFEDGPLTRRL